jgi:hypothetical protein
MEAFTLGRVWFSMEIDHIYLNLIDSSIIFLVFANYTSIVEISQYSIILQQ